MHKIKGILDKIKIKKSKSNCYSLGVLKGGIPIANPGLVVAVTLRSTYFDSHPP